MPLLQLVVLAVGLAMDAFAVAVTLGLGFGRTGWRKAMVVGLYFGIFQAGMPLIGFFAARGFADFVTTFDTWLVFAILAFLGGKMIVGALKDEADGPTVSGLGLRVMLPLALATSIDALAVGISFAFLEVNIFLAVLLIGVITLVISMAGVKIGGIFGERFKQKAAIAGGLILVIIGFSVLVEGLFLT